MLVKCVDPYVFSWRCLVYVTRWSLVSPSLLRSAGFTQCGCVAGRQMG